LGNIFEVLLIGGTWVALKYIVKGFNILMRSGTE